MNVNHDRLIYLLNQLFKDENANVTLKEKPDETEKSKETK
jgi:hypothetical protein